MNLSFSLSEGWLSKEVCILVIDPKWAPVYTLWINIISPVLLKYCCYYHGCSTSCLTWCWAVAGTTSEVRGRRGETWCCVGVQSKCWRYLSVLVSVCLGPCLGDDLWCSHAAAYTMGGMWKGQEGELFIFPDCQSIVWQGENLTLQHMSKLIGHCTGARVLFLEPLFGTYVRKESKLMIFRVNYF